MQPFSLLLLADNATSGGWQAIVDGKGISLALTGMLIVFVALMLVSGFIASVPKILEVLDPILPSASGHHAQPTPAEQVPLDQEKVIAAIGMVLHTEMQKAAQQKN